MITGQGVACEKVSSSDSDCDSASGYGAPTASIPDFSCNIVVSDTGV